MAGMTVTEGDKKKPCAVDVRDKSIHVEAVKLP